jgi:hypothetical protein
MSCPYFDPVAPWGAGSGPENAMLPLGGMWDGLCRAIPGEAWQPDQATLQPLCNLGYARGICARFPEGDGPDAVRFAVAGDDGATLRLCYVIEQNHHPFAHGTFAHGTLAHGAFANGPLDNPDAPAGISPPLLARQAGAYIRSYLRRKREACRP